MHLLWLFYLCIFNTCNLSAEELVAPVDGEIQGSSQCARVNGCKTLDSMFCKDLTHVTECQKCFYNRRLTNERNILRADFYQSVQDQVFMNRIKTCTDDDCPFTHADEMAKYMLMKDDRIARSPQGAIYKYFNIPSDIFYPERFITEAYTTTFCNKECVLAMKEVCYGASLITHIRNWCLDVLQWMEDEIPKLRGPPSFIAYLAAKATYSGNRYKLKPAKGTNWPRDVSGYASKDEKAVLIAAAATSILLAGDWWKQFGRSKIRDITDFGFAVQHSLFIAAYSGRIRITIQDADEFGSYEPGTKALCSMKSIENDAPNFSGVTGNVFAAICATFGIRRGRRNLRYRPEIHGRTDTGCVERTIGMAFIKPGDWITPEYAFTQMGSVDNPHGISFRTVKSDNTPLELYTTGVAQLFAPAVATDLKKYKETSCTGEKSKGGGSNLEGALSQAHVKISGICSWVASW